MMQSSEDERILAALAHASIVANVVNLGGMIATALIWTMQRERSRYVRAHALQALVYQGMVLLLAICLSMFWMACVLFSMVPAILRPDLYRGSPPQLLWLALLGVIVPLGFVGLAILYGLYAAYQTYHGEPFRYLVAGRLVRREFPGVGRWRTSVPQATARQTAPAAAGTDSAQAAAGPSTQPAPAPRAEQEEITAPPAPPTAELEDPSAPSPPSSGARKRGRRSSASDEAEV